MSLRPSIVVFALMFGCGAHAEGTLNSGQPDSGTASGSGSTAALCASICSGSGSDCGDACVQTCQSSDTFAPGCAGVYNALLRCAEPAGFRCPSSTMAPTLPSACNSQRDTYVACASAAVQSDAGSP